MDIETGWQSNCSELVVVLGGNTPSQMYAVFKTIMESLEDLTLGVKIYDFTDGHKDIFYPISDLSMLKFVKRKDGHYEIMVPMREVLKGLGRPTSDGVGEDLDWESPRFAVKKTTDVCTVNYGQTISVTPFDEFGHDLCAMTGDCDVETFPLIRALRDIFHGEVHPFDGGHTGSFEEWERYWNDKDYREGVIEAEKSLEYGCNYGNCPPIELKSTKSPTQKKRRTKR